MSQTDYYEIKKLLLEQKAILETLFPNKVSISFIKERTGLTRQGIRQKLINNFEPEVDFWQEGGKIFMSKSVALQLLNLIGD
jgi:hypothetical protein